MLGSPRRIVQFAGLLLAAVLLPDSASAAVRVPIEIAEGSVEIPENWRPIPRAEIVEYQQTRRAAQAGPADADVVAAFQQLPTLAWFSVPHVVVYWAPGTHTLPAAAGDASIVVQNDATVIVRRSGTARGGTLWFWHGAVLRPRGLFQFEYLATSQDDDAVRAFAASLQDHPLAAVP